MQKVIRRTIFAEKQAARRLARRKAKDERVWASENRKDIGRLRGDEVKQLEAARTARREDFFLGPLAPRRDVGDGKETYGTVTQSQLRLSEIPKSKRDEALKSVGGKFLNIVKGDRVVLLEGRDKGKIGKITDVDRSRASCKVEGLNMVSFKPLLRIPSSRDLGS
jgi:large subunit ribosomal protein L24